MRFHAGVLYAYNARDCLCVRHVYAYYVVFSLLYPNRRIIQDQH